MIGCNTLGYVVLDVVVVEHVVAVVEALWAKEVGCFNGLSIGVRHDHATLGVHLSVSTDVADADRASLLVYDERTFVLARWCIGVVEFPV